VPVREKLLEKYGARIDAFFSEEYFLEVVPCHVRKDLSLDALLSKLDIKSSELIAVGDGLNDIPMLKFAGLGVAVANAYAPVKDVADLIGLSNEDCAVAKIIEDYML
jgi:hydroxymethylpyrimidine pyrophosphatase-like HAD family hydrolase